MTDQMLSPKMLGYWTDDQRHDAPDESGIYCVFRAAQDPETGEMDVQELLYVGEHRSARYGLEHHEEQDRWRAFLQPGEELWYAVGLCGHANRERLAAAMINAHKPRFNSRSEYLDRFPFDETTVHIYGKKHKLQSIFTVDRYD
ncbi:hypothetical protein [Halomonas heilongjiangensis]|uniref:Uncharacterized protein n=1 Tax=Halomonas heilongjiangensis TaxID=1387883 RepID=A0A2N7TQB5_9GAMM|nr:hypothetical protein [Halomonas heilongjiangensis]PMR70383.1 hypothetical protein C1H66_06760 [Halomonas heilongjiangensis]PXX87635.1 hypothetical protein CR158_17685 [Halomonas heilongjiangensis]